MRFQSTSPAYALWFVVAAAAIAALVWLFLPAPRVQNAGHSAPGPAIGGGFRFAEQSGEALYANVCQACHMPDGKGAIGAGVYPPLAGNENLAAAGYPVAVVVNGRHGMPPVGAMMSDDQVAAVVNYVRTHFGNTYKDAVDAADVKVVRP